ncbi:MAG: hypothetical protein IPK79_03395 [Vampirovibrionales bacterium]|nr:hypothetical protein [Vampirovibrionales bacterium]
MSISRILVAAGGEDALKNGIKGFRKTKTLTTLLEPGKHPKRAAKKLLGKQLKKGAHASIEIGDKTIYVRRTQKGKIKEATADQFNRALEDANGSKPIVTADLVRDKLAKKLDGVNGKDSNSAFKSFIDAVNSKTASLGDLFRQASAAKAGGIKDKSKKEFDKAFGLLEKAYENQSPLQSATDKLRAMVQSEHDRAAKNVKPGQKARAQAALDAFDRGDSATIKSTTKTIFEKGPKTVKGKEFDKARKAYKAAAEGHPAPAPAASSSSSSSSSAKTSSQSVVADEMHGGYVTSNPYAAASQTSQSNVAASKNPSVYDAYLLRNPGSTKVATEPNGSLNAAVNASPPQKSLNQEITEEFAKLRKGNAQVGASSLD